MSSTVMTGTGSTDILFVGKTGHGKSATANTIVGYKAFESKNNFDSVTKSAQFEYREFEGRILKVVDGPGVCDSRSNPGDAKDPVKLVIDAMTIAVAANPAGYHAIVVVAKCGTRFTKEESEAIRLLKQIFGVDFIKKHGILLMTHGDNFATSDEATKESFEEWIRHQEGEIRDLIQECSGRVILFNNRERDEDRNKEQIRELLGIIDQLATQGQRYTSDIFNKGKEARDQLLRKSKRLYLGEESLMECGLITQELGRMKYDDPKSLHTLQNLLSRTSQLKKSIEQQDQGTKQLSVAINLAKQLNESVNELIKDASEDPEMKQMEAELEMARMQLAAEEEKRKEEERKHQKEREKQMSREKELVNEQVKNASKDLKMKEQMKQMEAELEMARMRLGVEEEKRKEEERKHQKEKEKQMSREKELATKLEKIREKKKKIIMEKEEVKQKQLEELQNMYKAVKQEDTWTWPSVVETLAAPVASLVNWWYRK